MMLGIGFLFAILSLVCIGIYSVFLKKVVSKIGEYACALYSTGALAIVLVVVSILSTRLKMPSDFVTAAIALGGLVGSFAFYLFYKSLHSGSASLVLSVTSMFIVWSYVVSCLIFGIRIGILQAIALVVSIISIILITMEKLSLPKVFDEEHIMLFIRSDLWSKGAGLALVASFCFTILFIAAGYGSGNIGPHRSMLYLAVLIVFFLLFAFLGRSAKGLVSLPAKSERRYLWIGIASFCAAAVFFYFAIVYDSMSSVVHVVYAFPVVAATGSALLLKEKLKFRQYLGIVLLTVSLIMISF